MRRVSLFYQAHGETAVSLGSGDVIRQLITAGLIDELRLFIHPLLGVGKHLDSVSESGREISTHDHAGPPV